jgi:Icc-related predicted phosphoesterase
MKIAAVGDIHVGLGSSRAYKELFQRISQEADVLLLVGDLTDTGVTEEADVLAQELTTCTIPVIGVLGNHDYDKGKEQEIKQHLAGTNRYFLEGELAVIDKVGFAGIKGFCGGFDNHMAPLWGEDAMKRFVLEAENDALRLDSALAKLDTEHQVEHKVVLLHYSPIRQTVVGESEEIFAFLGSSRLAEPLDRRKVNVAFHGHAHLGAPEGKTTGGVPIFNVSRALMAQQQPDKPWRMFEI